MDASRFDAIAKDLVSSTSRRRALGVFLAGVLGLTSLLGREEAEAKSCQKACEKKKDCKKKNDRKAKKKCKKQCKKSCNKGGFCAGRNSCQDGVAISTCQRTGAAEECVCLANADTGAPFCGLNQPAGGDCSATQCPIGQTCVDFEGGECTGGRRCALPCPNPI